MSFADIRSSDMQNAILNTSEFAEQINYVQDGASTTMNALIERGQLENDGYDQNHSLHKDIIIRIANDATAGMTSVSKGNDYVQAPEYPGGTNINWAVVDIESKTAASWRLRCTKMGEID